MGCLGGDAIDLAVFVGEGQHRAAGSLGVAVEFDVVLDLDESSRQGAVGGVKIAVEKPPQSMAKQYIR
jgi:hypothetical protein